MPEEVFFLSIFTIIGSTILLRDDMLTEVQQARHEIAELGERMDFAERPLAKRVEP